MTAIFLPISEITSLGASVLVEAEGAADKALAAASALPITEMIAEEKVGKLRLCKAVGGVIKAVFEVWNRTAIEKLRHGVYRGLTLVGLADGRDFTIERCALTDTATALAKSGSSGAATLYIDEVFKMSLFSTIEAIGKSGSAPRSGPLQVGAVPGGADNEAAVAMIRTSLASQRAAGVTNVPHSAFAPWLASIGSTNHPALKSSGGDALDRFLTRGRQQRSQYSQGAPAALELDPRKGR